jgi:hypothetical protein
MAKNLELESVAGALKPMDLDQAIRFLIRLVNFEGEMKGGDPGVIPSLVHGLRRYLLAPEAIQVEEQLRQIEKNKNLDALKEIVRALKEFLTPIAIVSDANRDADDGDKEKMTRLALRELSKTLYKPKGTVVTKLSSRDGVVYSIRDGALVDIVMDTATEDFDDEKVEELRVGQCQLCGELFYKVKLNQRYCNHQCANKAAATRRANKELDESAKSAGTAPRRRGWSES